MTKRIFNHLNYLNVEAQFSSDNEFRYSLSLTHKERAGGQTICLIMQNPSLANIEHADKTIQFMEKLIFEKNYPQFKRAYKLIVVNQFAFMQTKDFKGESLHIGPKNDAAIASALLESDDVIIGWGKTNPFIDRQLTIFNQLQSFNGNGWVTKKHPSRGHYDDFLVPLELPKAINPSGHNPTATKKKVA